MTAKLFWIVLVLGCLLAESAFTATPLPVIYSENDDDEEEIVESQQGYIDNQAYLREFERQRRQRVLSSNGRVPVAVMSSKRESVRTYGPWRYRYPEYQRKNRFLGMEYQSGNTIIRYYDGYQPNCCSSRTYIIYPRPRPPRPVPYSRPSSSKKR